MASATQILGYFPDHGKNQLNSTTDESQSGDQPDASSPESHSPPSTLYYSALAGRALQAPPPDTQKVTSGDGAGGGGPGDGPQTAEDESWTNLVARLQIGDTAAMAELYQVFAKGIRFYLCRQVGPQELDDRVHDAFLIVVQSIKRGELRDPRRLMGFVRTVVRRMVAAQIDRDVQVRRDTIELNHGDRIADQRANPEKSVIMRQKISLIREVLDKLSAKDQEILRRFYVEEQHPEQICDEMNLSITQFRLLKSRAKARFGEEGRKKLQPGATICDDPMRTFG